jgi:hypothetical protein
VGDIVGAIHSAAASTNLSYDNSRVVAGVRIAHVAPVVYDEFMNLGNYAQHVALLRGTTDGIMDGVHALRNQYLADAVLLILDDGALCGRASQIGSTSVTAFAAVWAPCLLSGFTFAHELGHLQSARHDLQTDGTLSPYAYGHGYIAPDRSWRTIMAYADKCNQCAALPYWSNPNVLHPQQGIPMGTATREDNARVLNNTRLTLRDFRTLPAPNLFELTNSSERGEHPHFTWQAVPGADVYNLYRCLRDPDNDILYPSCFVKHGRVSGTVTQFVDYYATITWTSRGSCPGYNSEERQAIYRVSAQNRTGESGWVLDEYVCVFEGR